MEYIRTALGNDIILGLLSWLLIVVPIIGIQIIHYGKNTKT